MSLMGKLQRIWTSVEDTLQAGEPSVRPSNGKASPASPSNGAESSRLAALEAKLAEQEQVIKRLMRFRDNQGKQITMLAENWALADDEPITRKAHIVAINMPPAR